MGPLDPGYQRDRSFRIVTGLLTVAFVAVFSAWILTRPPRPRAVRAGLRLVQSAPPPRSNGGSLISVPSVRSEEFDQRLVVARATTGGELEISLAWNSVSDLDLQVRDPAGELISARRRRSQSGGVQDVDANPTLVNEAGRSRSDAGQSPGPENVVPLPEWFVDMDKNPELKGFGELLLELSAAGDTPSRFTRTPVEHTYFADAPPGTYTVYAHCYSSREPPHGRIPFTVQIRHRGQVFHQASGIVGPESFVTHLAAPVEVCRFTVP